jgi:hypothetical protein
MSAAIEETSPHFHRGTLMRIITLSTPQTREKRVHAFGVAPVPRSIRLLATNGIDDRAILQRHPLASLKRRTTLASRIV